ncbi:hypothetical protein E2C01_047952 [Portunus trituberculatus]|uniref:Uncharacterized protein n=1 Tax=Portunus trituberculatus TaxID=210409 RepID=A0A5B7G988_PORTR|nr:hypothetical protein [Portunus trituberculatus]
MRHTSLMACQLSGHNLKHVEYLKRYVATWDVKPVLQKIRAMDLLHSLSLKDLSLKLVMLMAVTQAARVQTLHLIMLRNIAFGEDSI